MQVDGFDISRVSENENYRGAWENVVHTPGIVQKLPQKCKLSHCKITNQIQHNFPFKCDLIFKSPLFSCEFLQPFELKDREFNK